MQPICDDCCTERINDGTCDSLGCSIFKKKYPKIRFPDLVEIIEKNGIKYEINDITEKKYINELLILFEKLTLIGFGLTEPNMFEDEKYRILITPSRKKRFYIKDQNNKKMYYSKKYEQEQNGNVLYAFINYLRIN